ncbi:hypothetical protein [Acetomicrobium sp.]|uniref:hypothetical protein n=1 Tax=Acetomicrobium sp. TaxID=1872099 RepID=UPI001BCF40ED|nr:hypothetical protein [Acetomicrobium sp.]
MAYNFISSDRDRMYLLPPNMRDWLPGNHLLWFIMDIVPHLDLTPFYKRYNPKGEGRATYKAQRDGKITPLHLTTVSTMEYKLLTPEGRNVVPQ